MIIKYFNLKKEFNKKIDLYLLYGENTGLIEEVINTILKPHFSNNIFTYNEDEVLDNIDTFKEQICTKSFFENDRVIIINKSSDKILNIVTYILEKKIDDLKLILKSDLLEKKSKLRVFFEKSEHAIIVPFYEDDQKTLTSLAQILLSKNKIKITQENLNIIVKRASGNRINLKNELNKIINYCQNKSSINHEEIVKITNLADNFRISDLVDNYLLNNKKILINILNENNTSEEDNIIIIKIFLNKLKKLKKLRENIYNENLEKAISEFKPPIFWKDKEIIKKQLQSLNLKQINILIKHLNYLELKIKKNFGASKKILSNFLIEKIPTINNYF